MIRKRRFVPMVAAALAIPAALWSLQPGGVEREPLDPAGVQRLVADTGGAARVTIHPATGAARFVRLAPGAEGGLAPKRARVPASFEEASEAFFFEYGSIFGIQEPRAELVLEKVATDGQGMTSLTYRQFHRGVPVFAGELKTHFNARKQLSAVNGTFVPMDAINTSPSRSWQEASQVALGMVEKEKAVSEPLGVRGTALLVYRSGLIRGIPGQNHLVWEVEVGNGADVREFVYVDAHSGKVVDQITGIHDAMFRRAYDGANLPNPPPSYPDSPYWQEGDPFPTASSEANNMILASKDTYDLYFQAFLRDSFDNQGTKMDSIFNRGYQCPNASWNGTFISFCPGLTTDDVTGHEWTHAYTQYTHGLIYAWQPGALNESYSDIYGETIDRINGRDDIGNSATDPFRVAVCTTYTPQPPVITINSPAAIAGNKIAGTAAFGPQSFSHTADVVVANDGVAVNPGETLSDGCCAGPSFVCAPGSWPNAAAIAGKIALVDRGVCGFAIKVKNAQNNGASGAIVANNTTGIVNMAGTDSTITIPALSIGQTDGNAIKAQTSTVNATMTRTAGSGTEPSTRWLVGEDDTAVGLTGALRDMYVPSCYFNPGKVSDALYGCGTADNGGVHNNSGVPNHAYALLVDGGTFNSQTISAIGLTKAAHIYFRAMSVYQGPASDFPDHADSIEQSCSDLTGVNLADLLTGAPSGQVISPADCASVHSAALAVELRTPPTQCNFQPLLGQTPPADPACGAGTARVNLLVEGFEGSTSGWTISHEAVGAGYDEPDWVVSSTLPDGRAGKAFFAEDPNIGGCNATDDESGVRHLTSPAIALPKGSSGHTVTFEHWVSTEASFDGGQLMISVNGGAFTLVPQANFIYNGYNLTLASAGAGNTNPRAGQRAWSGTDGGAVDGTWGRSIVSLAGLASAGQTIQLRWDMSTDGCGGTTFGWYVDNVTVYACLPTANPTISINDITVTEGNSGSTPAVFTVSLSHASTKTITVKHKTNNGTAKSELDYIKNLEKTLTFPPLSSSASITVQVLGETLVEPNETFFVDLSKPTNATIADSQGKCTITNDD
jgi:Zn-dependent metalloprotease